jgi:hypothetical protein
LRRISIGGGLAVLLVLAVPACGPAPGPDGANEGAAANGAVAAPEPAAAPLVLEGAGLRIPGASPPRTVAFDTSEAEAIAALTKALGRPPADRGENEECGGGGMEYAAWKDEITIWFLDGRFAGWDLKGRLKTAGGIGLGSSRAELAPLPGLEIEESTLGTEFRAGGMSGLLGSKGPDARIVNLWGGATCVFR